MAERIDFLDIVSTFETEGAEGLEEALRSLTQSGATFEEALNQIGFKFSDLNDSGLNALTQIGSLLDEMVEGTISAEDAVEQLTIRMIDLGQAIQEVDEARQAAFAEDIAGRFGDFRDVDPNLIRQLGSAEGLGRLFGGRFGPLAGEVAGAAGRQLDSAVDDERSRRIEERAQELFRSGEDPSGGVGGIFGGDRFFFNLAEIERIQARLDELRENERRQLEARNEARAAFQQEQERLAQQEQEREERLAQQAERRAQAEAEREQRRQERVERLQLQGRIRERQRLADEDFDFFGQRSRGREFFREGEREEQRLRREAERVRPELGFVRRGLGLFAGAQQDVLIRQAEQTAQRQRNELLAKADEAARQREEVGQAVVAGVVAGLAIPGGVVIAEVN